MATKHCALLGIPIQDGAGRPGCEMGPSALRTAGIAEAITELGFRVTDLGNAAPAPPKPMNHCNGALKALPQVSAWTGALIEAAYTASAEAMPIFMGLICVTTQRLRLTICKRPRSRAGMSSHFFFRGGL